MSLVLLLTRNLIGYKYSQAFIATREDPLLAASIGVKSRKYRMLAFVISTAMAGAAGSLYSHYTLFISPDSFHLGESIYIATMVIIGGRGTILRPVVGAILLTTLPEDLRFYRRPAICSVRVDADAGGRFHAQGSGKGVHYFR